MITTENLSFSYKDKCVLKNVSIEVPKGGIYGYLGKNGAGKSTTIKILLGLLKAQSGAILYDGRQFTEKSLDRIGNLIESPSFYNHLTAYENLKYLDILFHHGDDRISEVLSMVDLNSARNKKAKKFSSGMKQRLGIALALFHAPDILILDEPLNGLDPEGVHDMRKLIVRLHHEGKTILLSSHILSEIEKVCTHIGILDAGQLIYQGPIRSLMSNINQRVTVETNNVSKAKSVCRENGFEVTNDSEDLLMVLIPNKNEYNRMINVLSSDRIEIFSIKSDELDLESVFLTLTSHQTK